MMRQCMLIASNGARQSGLRLHQTVMRLRADRQSGMGTGESPETTKFRALAPYSRTPERQSVMRRSWDQWAAVAAPPDHAARGNVGCTLSSDWGGSVTEPFTLASGTGRRSLGVMVSRDAGAAVCRRTGTGRCDAR
jgi:hypothetical protein